MTNGVLDGLSTGAKINLYLYRQVCTCIFTSTKIFSVTVESKPTVIFVGDFDDIF